MSVITVTGNSLQAVSLYRKQRNCFDSLILSLSVLFILTGLSSTAIAITRLNMAELEKDKEIIVVFFLYLTLLFAILSSASHIIIIDFEQSFFPGFPFAQCLQTPKMKKLIVTVCAWITPAFLVLAVQFYPPLASEITIGFSIAIAVLSIWLLKKLPFCECLKSLIQRNTSRVSQQQSMLSSVVLSVCSLAVLLSAMMCIGRSSCSALAIRMCILITSIMNPIVYFSFQCGQCCDQAPASSTRPGSGRAVVYHVARKV